MSFKHSAVLSMSILSAFASMPACAAQASKTSTISKPRIPSETDHGMGQKRIKQAPPPGQTLQLPPTIEQSKFNLPPRKSDARNTAKSNLKNLKSTIAPAPPSSCTDMNLLASYSGSALADYLVNLPDYECTYPLFQLSSGQAATIYSAANYNAVANRFAQEASNYNASNMALVNLTLYLRAGYYLADTTPTAAAPTSIKTGLRSSITNLINGNQLFRTNSTATSTAGEVMKLITNMYEEAYYLPSVKNVFVRFTNSVSTPNAATALQDATASNGFTGALTVMYYAHFRSDAIAVLQDTSYANALNSFVTNNKNALINTYYAYQLKDASNEAFRFMQYAALKPSIKPMIQNQLNTSTMTGTDSDLWLAAASAVKYYDNSNCAEYGVCNFETTLANAVLKTSYSCGPTLKIRAQDMSASELQSSCDLLAAEETYFHTMLPTNRTPVNSDNNRALELVIFDDYTNYNKYAGIIYGISTNNGGMYLEGNPADTNNQARFIAHEASWLRPSFSVWNLEHEYIHYLDGRFNMFGDFGTATSVPTVWWIEGVAEYLSHKNDHQSAIDLAKSGSYKLSTIFGNTYSMSDYVNRAYPWGYMAVRFMNEKHRTDVDSILQKFRIGDYQGYQTFMNAIGTRYDSEFASWVQTATTAGSPPLPIDAVTALPNCNTNYWYYLGNNCSVKGLSSSTESYVYVMVPPGAKNLKIFTGGGSGDVDLYVRKDGYPTTTTYDGISAKSGNSEAVTFAAPSANSWYYIMLKARTPYTNVSVGASWE